MKSIFKLFVLGDIGLYNNILKNSVNICENRMRNNDKILLLGDNFYHYGVDNLKDKLWIDYKNTFKNISSENVYSILGNHDYIKNPKCQVNNKYWATPNFYYKLEFSLNIDLFFLDTMLLYHGHCGITKELIESKHKKNADLLKNEQLNWLDKELNESKNKRKIIFGHYPMISNGLYYDSLDPLNKLLLPIFKKYEVDAYISGHEHNIQYISKNYSNYILNQFIIGSSAENRINEKMIYTQNDMYDNKDNFILVIKELSNEKIIFKFVDSNNNLKYSYII